METPNSRKRKRQTISLSEKQEIIEAAKTRTPAQLAKHFNDKYKEDTIRKIVNSKDKIEKAIDDGADGKQAFSRAVKFPKLEEALLKWLKDVRSENVAVDGPMLKVGFNLITFNNFVNFRRKLLTWPNYSKLAKMTSKQVKVGSQALRDGTALSSSNHKEKPAILIWKQ